jgi:antitoxin component YwqK of YwqJK toxin-antitoxin module
LFSLTANIKMHGSNGIKQYHYDNGQLETEIDTNTNKTTDWYRNGQMSRYIFTTYAPPSRHFGTTES